MNNTSSEVQLNDDLNDRYLLFKIEDLSYGLPLSMVLEILTIQSITRLPCVASYIKGIINLRGKVIPVIDVRSKLGLPEREYDEKTSIIIMELYDLHVGLIVDMVSEVITISQDRVIAPPDDSASFIASVSQLDNKVVLNLDCDLFFKNDLDFTPV